MQGTRATPGEKAPRPWRQDVGRWTRPSQLHTDTAGQPRPLHQAAHPGHRSPRLPQGEAPGSTGHSVWRVPPTPLAGAMSQHHVPRSLGTADLGHARLHLLLTGTQPAPGRNTFSKHTSSILATRSLHQEQKEMLRARVPRLWGWTAGQQSGRIPALQALRTTGGGSVSPGVRASIQEIHGHLTGTLPSSCGSTEGTTEGTHLRVNTRRVLRGATRTRWAVSVVSAAKSQPAGRPSHRGAAQARLEGRVD